MMRFTLVFLFILPFSLLSQDFSDQWTAHFSYFNTKDVYTTPENVYVASENGIFIHNIASQNNTVYSTINGLSGEEITTIYHSDAYNITYIGYQNGLLELITGEGVRTFVDIFQKPTIPPNEKKINHFYETGGELLISTDFGIVVFNQENIEFGDTYFIGPGGTRLKITATAISGNTIYASTSGQGIYTANYTFDNLVDFNQWSQNFSGGYSGLVLFNDTILTWQNTQLLEIENSVLTPVVTSESGIVDVQANATELAVSTNLKTTLYNSAYQSQVQIESTDSNPMTITAATSSEGSVFLGTRNQGLMKIAKNNIADRVVLSPKGPLRNDSFAVEAQNDVLWMVYGGFDIAFFPSYQSKGVSKLLPDGTWMNLSPEELLGATSLSHISINPNNEEQVFISSYENGLLEINNNKATQLYDATNSDFESLVPDGNVVRLNGSVFDSQGDLWINTSRVDDALVRYSPDDQEIFKVNVASALTGFSVGYTDTVIDADGNVFFGGGSTGVIGYSQSLENVISIKEESNLPTDFVSALAVDKDNQLWIGTFSGLRVLFNPFEAFRTGNTNTNQIIILDDEQVPQELLFDQSITDIEVDGSNNKWISTGTSGVFYFSADGQQTLAKYTTENSPLPSNNVLDISVDDSTGSVFFATAKGLVEFKGTALGPAESLEEVTMFPNPVRPAFNGSVTIRGLTARANVKVTDIEGNLVYEEISQGGSIQWDTTAFGRHKVASGVYLVLVTAEDASETTVSKLLIVR